MNVATIAALLFAALTAGAVGFQIALALGIPWGAYAMGGRYPGRFPPKLRLAAVVQAALLLFLAGVVLARAGMVSIWQGLTAPWLIWVVVAFSGVSAVLNTITPSKPERRIWLPVAILLLGSSLLVALLT